MMRDPAKNKGSKRANLLIEVGSNVWDRQDIAVSGQCTGESKIEPATLDRIQSEAKKIYEEEMQRIRDISPDLGPKVKS